MNSPKIDNLHLLELSSYEPGLFLDKLAKRLNMSSDRELSKALGIPSSVISKIRHKAIPISAKNLLAIHDVSELSIKKLRKMMGDHRKFFS
jgi:hypothetical protein